MSSSSDNNNYYDHEDDDNQGQQTDVNVDVNIDSPNLAKTAIHTTTLEGEGGGESDSNELHNGNEGGTGQAVNWTSCIVHIDLDAFYASVEEVLNPSLKGLPIIVVMGDLKAGGGGRGAVATASYAARRYGIHSAMPLTGARKLCPERELNLGVSVGRGGDNSAVAAKRQGQGVGVYLPVRHEVYAEFSSRVMALLQAFQFAQFDFDFAKPLPVPDGNVTSLSVANSDINVDTDAEAKSSVTMMTNQVPTPALAQTGKVEVVVVEQVSIDEAYLDLSAVVVCRNSDSISASAGMSRSIDPVELMTILKNRIYEQTGLTASVGIATNKLTAKMASGHHKPAGLTVVLPNQEAQFLALKPVAKLHGVGPKTVERLAKLDITTIGDLARADLVRLQATFGKRLGLEMQEHALGIDRREVIGRGQHEAKSLSAERTFAQDTDDPRVLWELIQRMATELEGRLAERGLVARTISIKLRLSNWRLLSRAESLPVATCSGAEIAATAGRLMRRAWQRGTPLRLLGVRVSNFTSITSNRSSSSGAFSSDHQQPEPEPTNSYNNSTSTNTKRQPNRRLPDKPGDFQQLALPLHLPL